MGEPRELSVAVPFHTSQDGMLEACFQSIRSNTDVPTEIIAIDDHSDGAARAIAESYADLIIPGPGLANWRPGAIHWPVFHAWLTTKCPFVTYLFSDDLSHPPRYKKQVEVLKRHLDAPAVYCNTSIISFGGTLLRKERPATEHLRFGSIPTYTESLVIRRAAFEAIGGLDFPIHTAAMAEAWIWAACGASGRLCYIDVDGFSFREHPGTLTNSAKARYDAAVAKTRFLEEDHWRLWRRVEPRFKELVELARKNDT